MLVLLSPSKTLDYETEPQTTAYTQPALLDESETLIDILREFDIEGLRELMDISEDLATLNIERYDAFETPFTTDNAKQAILAFDGDVYRDFEFDDYDEGDFSFLQDHVGILSGLYGYLRPLDLMQPYRLEMGTKLDNPRGDDLYDFWGDRITDQVNAALDNQGDEIVLNLASNEYFDSVNTDELAGRILNVKFKDLRGDTYRTITFYLKRLRGTMTNWMVQNGVTEPEALKQFDERGYYFSDERSTDDEYVFLRDEKP
jgi:hypothetical protein